MMRIIFLYVQNKANPRAEWNPSRPATNFYSKRVCEEGYFWLLKRMVEEEILDEVVVVVESGLGQGYINYNNPNIHGWVIPDMAKLPLYTKGTDIIWVRGGFKSWYETLVKLKEERNQRLLLYAANTGRERWPIFDVIFNDLDGTNTVDPRGTLQFDFIKPINPNVFYPTFEKEPEYDVCIGASNIHDKKGQWRTVEALLEYKRIFGKNLKCVMPGACRRGVNTNKMMETLTTGEVNVFLPGTLSRSRLNRIYNNSKLFIHLGGGGQGDRGPLEALRCGTPVVVGNTRRHSKIVYQNPDISFVVPEKAKPEAIARTLHYLNKDYCRTLRKEVSDYYAKHASVDQVILPGMKKLFDTFRKDNKN